jgi:hypothetical protein
MKPTPTRNGRSSVDNERCMQFDRGGIVRAGLVVAILLIHLLTGCNRISKVSVKQRPHWNDSPGAAERYQVAQRTPPVARGQNTLGIPIERYEGAISHLRQMTVYSTATRKSFKVQRRLRTPWIKSFHTRDALVFETLVSPLAKLSSSPSIAAPFASLVSSSISELQTASALGTWTPLGPSDAGGRARSLIINPPSHDVRIMLLATAGGGIWRTIDGGVTWVPVFDDKPILSVSSLAMAPSDYRILYAGTGEGFENIDAIRGNGIYRSLDNGITWTLLAETKDKPDFSYVQKIAVSPSSPSRVYAATGTGVFVCCSTDGSWNRLRTSNGPLDASQIGGCTDLAVQNKTPSGAGPNNYVFVACGNLNDGSLYRTTDSATPGILELVLSTRGRSSLAISPSQPSVVYAMATDAKIEAAKSGPGLQMVFRSDRDGASGTWQSATNMGTRLNRMLLTNVDFAYNSKCKLAVANDGTFQDSFLDQGWYDNVLAVDPSTPNTVLAGGIDLFRSDDRGANWGITSYWRSTPNNVGSTAHADVHAIVFHPEYGKTNHTVFIATDGGVFRTDNANASLGHDPCGAAAAGAVKWVPINSGLSTTQFYSGAVFPNGTQYIGGTQDNGTFFGGADTGGTQKWKQIIGGDGGTTLVDSYNPGNVYATLPPAATVQIYKSTTGPGGEFLSAINNLSGNFLFVTPLAMDPQSSAILWTGGDQVFRTTNAANDWQPASNLFISDNYGDEDSGIVSSVAVSPFSSNTVLAGTSYDEESHIGGWIHRTNAGLSANTQTVWKRSRPRRGWVSSIAFDPSNKGVVYATYSSFNSGSERGHVFKSNLQGDAPWEPADGPCAKSTPTPETPEPCNIDNNSLPDIPVHTIVVDPGNSQRIWVGTDIGIFTTLDGGKTWAQENAGFRAPVSMLVLDSHGPTLYAFTHGRGVWRVKVD